MAFAQGMDNFAQEDAISNMPDIVVTNILDRLPLQDALKTSILSRNWRFKWTMHTQLVFDDNFFARLSKTKDRNNHLRIISRLLLNIRGSITKFVLLIDDHGDSVLNDEDISHWILFLSQKGIKDLTIEKRSPPFLKLPTHLVSCLGLKHLKLSYCSLYPPSNFHGFPNLLSLQLMLLELKSWNLGEFVMRCPVLEDLKVHVVGKVKLDEIAKLANLKTLSFFWCSLEKLTITDSSSSTSTISDLLGFLPKLQELELDFSFYQFTELGAKKRFATNFLCLKTLKLSHVNFHDGNMLSYVLEMIKSFPNLQILEIMTTTDMYDWPPPALCFPEVDYNTTGLLQLRSVVFTYWKASEDEVCLVRYLLGVHLS